MSNSAIGQKKCPDKCCVNSDVQREDGILVCINCGQLSNSCSDQLTNDPTQEYSLNFRSDDVKSYVSNNKNFPNRFPVGKRLNTKVIELLFSNLSLEADVKIQAMAKFKDMVGGHFLHSSEVTKRILAAISVYTSLINDKTPVTIGHICNEIGCSTSEFNKVYNQVIVMYPNYKSEQMPIESLVSVTLSETKIDENEKKIICEKVKKILELSRECWLIEGRTPAHIIFAATFLAWKSIKPYERRGIKLNEFCRKVGIDYKHTTSQRVTELFNAIRLLSTNSGLSVGSTITKSNIGIYLDKILDYKTSLVYDYNQKLKRLSGIKNNGCSEDNPNDKPSDWMNIFKRKASDKRSKQNGTVGDDCQTDLTKSDEEFSDSDINSYLRTDKEVKYIKKLKKFANDCQEYGDG